MAFLPDPLESHQKSFHYLQSYFTKFNNKFNNQSVLEADDNDDDDDEYLSVYKVQTDQDKIMAIFTH